MSAPIQPVVSKPSLPFAPYYDEDGITIYNMDCRKILPWLGKFDLLLTDPPYGLDMASKGWWQGGENRGNNKAKARQYSVSDWDAMPPRPWVVAAMKDSASTSILWGGNYYEGLPPSPCWLVWDKDNSGNFADCELAWTNMAKAVRKFKWRWNGMLQEHGGDKKESRVHPTQKPVALMRWCLSLVEDAATVLDPFAGSGTTGVACKLEGRKAVLIEISEEYCESAAKRLSQGVLF